MNPTTYLVLALVVVAALAIGAALAHRFANRTTIGTPEQEAAQALERGLAFLLDDSPDDKAIAAAQKRKTSRAALRAQVAAEIAAAIAPAGPAS